MTPTEMYRTCKPTLDGILKGLAPKADEDFTQEVWCRLMPLATKIDPAVGKPEHLFYIAARNTVLDMIRAKKLRGKYRTVREPEEADLVVMPQTEGFPMPVAKSRKVQKQYALTAKMLEAGYTQVEIAKELGVVPMRVNYLVNELRNDGQRTYIWGKYDIRKAA